MAESEIAAAKLSIPICIYVNSPGQLSFLRNSSLQAAYFILTARALGLDCGPMSGFDADKLNASFFPDGKWKVNLLCNLVMETQASSTHAILGSILRKHL